MWVDSDFHLFLNDAILGGYMIRRIFPFLFDIIHVFWACFIFLIHFFFSDWIISNKHIHWFSFSSDWSNLLLDYISKCFNSVLSYSLAPAFLFWFFKYIFLLLVFSLYSPIAFLNLLMILILVTWILCQIVYIPPFFRVDFCFVLSSAHLQKNKKSFLSLAF